MRPQRLIVSLLTLALSLGVAIAYVQRPERAPAPLPPPALPVPVAEAPTPAAQPVASPPSKPKAPAFSWRQVESEDYHLYIANLRSIGCPEQTIRDIIVADVNRLYAARENPLKAKPQSRPDNPAGETPEQRLERLTQLRAVQQEKRWVVKELLGIDLPLDMLPSSGSRDYHAFEVAFRFLPEGKRDAVQVLQEANWQQLDALQAKYGAKKTPEFLAESRQLNDTLRQELAKVLTPQELEDYDLRTSQTAKDLSTKLGSYFRPTEDEFRKIYRAKREYEDAVGRLSAPSPATLVAANSAANPAINPADRQALAQQRAADKQALDQARSTALNQLNEQLKTTLGDSRYTEYERSQDRTYDLLARLGVRYNLPQETVLQAYDLQKSFQSTPGPVGAAPQKADQAELQRQLNDQLTAILGEQAARGYRRVNGGTIPVKPGS